MIALSLEAYRSCTQSWGQKLNSNLYHLRKKEVSFLWDTPAKLHSYLAFRIAFCLRKISLRNVFWQTVWLEISYCSRLVSLGYFLWWFESVIDIFDQLNQSPWAYIVCKTWSKTPRQKFTQTMTQVWYPYLKHCLYFSIGSESAELEVHKVEGSK